MLLRLLAYYLINQLQQIKLCAMLPNSNKKTRLTVQDFRMEMQQLKQLVPVRFSSLQPKPLNKRPIFTSCNSEKQSEYQEVHSTQLRSPQIPQLQINTLEKYSQKLLVFPHRVQIEEEQEDDKLKTYSSMRLGKLGYHKIQKNISERYHQKIEALKQFRIPIVSQTLLTISHFSNEALSSIPKNVEIFNEKLKQIKKSIGSSLAAERYTQKKELYDVSIPSELKTFRVIRNLSEQKGEPQTARKSSIKFRSTLRRRSKKSLVCNPQVYKIDGWQLEQLQKQKQQLY